MSLEQGGSRSERHVLVQAVLAVLVCLLVAWAAWLQVRVARLDAEVARLKAPIFVTGQPERQFTSVNDLALALLKVHDREKGLEASLEQDIHSGGTTLLHTHQYIDNKRWSAGAQSEAAQQAR